MKVFLQKIRRKFIFNFSNPKTRFTEIYKTNYWSSEESISGPGSELEKTESIRKLLPIILKKYNVESFLDLPCGDFLWMKHINLNGINYIGGDIVDELIINNNKKYKERNINFRVLNLIDDDLPEVDMILVRDCFIHLSENLILKTIKNLKRSKIKYLLTNNFSGFSPNQNIKTGTFRRVNFNIAPYHLSQPLEIFEETEHFSETFGSKELVIYKISDL